MAIEDIFLEAGFPEGCFTALLMPGAEVEPWIAHPHIRAVTLTGSAEAGRAIARKAGECLKKTVLELGGSDAYVVLADANIELAAMACAKSRLMNGGQSCISAKRFIVEASVHDVFLSRFLDIFRSIHPGAPQDEKAGIGPLARADLRDALHDQVLRSVAQGAELELGGEIPKGLGAFYPPTVLSHVKPGMAAFDEELFGPVAAIVKAKNETEAFAFANATRFGLGSAIFSEDIERTEALARTVLDAGQTFVNDFVRSDPRLPFGGTKESGFGRELGALGIREFVNAKTVYVA